MSEAVAPRSLIDAFQATLPWPLDPFQVEAIEKLEAAGTLEQLPPALREMARWRRANPELNLGELAKRMELSKSAVNHRLRRLQELADHLDGHVPPKPARRSA